MNYMVHTRQKKDAFGRTLGVTHNYMEYCNYVIYNLIELLNIAKFN